MKKIFSRNLFIGLLFVLSLHFTALTSCFSKKFTVWIIYVHVAIAPKVVFIYCPSKSGLNCRSWLPWIHQQIKCLTDQSLLHSNVPWFSAWVSKWKINKQKSWYTAFLNNISCRTNHDSADSFWFKMSCNQTHGLVADWSKWNQNGNVNSVFFTPF